MSVVPSRGVHYTYAEYRGFENSSPGKHEYIGGEICAMAGGTPEHAAFPLTISALLRPQLRRGCRMFTSDLRVRMPQADVATYPHLTIICGDPEHASDDELAFTNPIVLIEVTSNSTEGYDGGKKVEFYKTIDSLREVLIVSHREAWFTLHRRGDKHSWSVLDARAGESVTLESVAATLSVDDVYNEVFS